VGSVTHTREEGVYMGKSERKRKEEDKQGSKRDETSAE